MANEITATRSSKPITTRARLNYATTTRGFDYEATVEIVVESDHILTSEEQGMVDQAIQNMQSRLRQQGEDGVAQRNMDLQMRPPVKANK